MQSRYRLRMGASPHPFEKCPDPGFDNNANGPCMKILIYRLGSLGDTVVALPAFHLIERAFLHAERRVLTNFPVTNKAAPLQSILEGSGLVHGYFSYPAGSRAFMELSQLALDIRRWKPDVLVYLAAPRGTAKLVRDYTFFKTCGISRIVGMPWTGDLQQRRYESAADYYEGEANRLARCLASLGDADLKDDANWDLRLTAAEQTEAAQLLEGFQGRNNFICASIGTKVSTKDWGADNWSELLRRLAQQYSKLGLLMVGAGDEVELSDRVAQHWRGPVLNLCGRSAPRVSAALMAKAKLFMGHDSGPMHLAAAVGTPCVAVFGARNRPGEWFPRGDRHAIVYNKTDCFGCGLDICTRYNTRCIREIDVSRVIIRVERLLDTTLSSKQ